MDKMAGNKDNVVYLEMNEKVLDQWKEAYKNCKEQRSIMVKDSYDEFISKIKENYKNNVKNVLKKNSNKVDVITFRAFFEDVVDRSAEYLKIVDNKKGSKFYREKRKDAVEKLESASQGVLGVLTAMIGKAENDSENDADVFKKEYKVDITKPLKTVKSIKNCVYSYVTDLGGDAGARMYLILTVNHLGGVLGAEDFNFGSYKMDGKTVKEDPKSRNIYLVAEKNINMGVSKIDEKLTLKVSAYISPNNMIVDGAAGFLINNLWLDVDGEAITKVVM